jgi:hypothetical protein
MVIPGKRSIGGLGKLYDDGQLVGNVYYNIKQDQQRGLLCTVVFLGRDIEIPEDNRHYRLILEDGRYLIVTLRHTRPTAGSPYAGISCDGILHAASEN